MEDPYFYILAVKSILFRVEVLFEASLDHLQKFVSGSRSNSFIYNIYSLMAIWTIYKISRITQKLTCTWIHFEKIAILKKLFNALEIIY